MIGLKVDKPAVLLLDNEAIVTNSTLPSSSLKKKHNAISYCNVYEAVAAGFVKIAHIGSKQNRSDLLSKPANPPDNYLLLESIIFINKREKQSVT